VTHPRGTAQNGDDRIRATMNNESRLVSTQVGLIIESFLRNNIANSFNIFNHKFTLIKRHIWQPLVTGNGFISQQSNCYLP